MNIDEVNAKIEKNREEYQFLLGQKSILESLGIKITLPKVAEEKKSFYSVTRKLNKATHGQVAEIKWLLANTQKTISDLVAIYGVSEQTVIGLKDNTIYKQVAPNRPEGFKKTSDNIRNIAKNRYSPNPPKLTFEQAEKIRELREKGKSTKELASKFGVSPSTVYMICLNKAYTQAG